MTFSIKYDIMINAFSYLIPLLIHLPFVSLSYWQCVTKRQVNPNSYLIKKPDVQMARSQTFSANARIRTQSSKSSALHTAKSNELNIVSLSINLV